jgi:pimeloyl-ACP methyl ester carboxylesterase
MKRHRSSTWLLWLLAIAVLASTAAAADQQASQLRAVHRAGQTFLTWQEVDPPVKQDAIAVEELNKLRQGIDDAKKVRYRIYRSAERIASLAGLKPVAEVPPLSCWNADFYGDPWSKKPALRYVIEEGRQPLAPGTGLCVLNPERSGPAWYAVTLVVDGQENPQLGPGNALATPVDETVGQGVPVLQRTERPEEFSYVKNPTLHYFVRWESPPNCAAEGKPIDYLVAFPPNPAKPAPVGIHLHCWGGSLNGGYGWWYQAEQGHLLLASNQIPYDWWTGYHEAYWQTRGMDAGTKREAWEKGVVRAYSQQRMLSFLDWVATKWPVDLTRTHVAGNSMGGSGSPMFAIRHPERIAWATGWVGVHIPAESPHFKNSYEQVYGPPEWQIKFEDGTPVWDYFDDAWYLRHHPEKEIGLICFSNGKNDGGIGWGQAQKFFRALQETHRPHVFVWGQSGHGQRALLPVSRSDRTMPMDLRVDQSQPAFTRCSLDDNPGNGDPADGDPQGQANLYLYWKTEDVTDRDDAWEMTVGLIDAAPRDECAVDITPRRLQKFHVEPGAGVRWTNAALADGRAKQSGQSTADQNGLVTLEAVRIDKGGNRIRLAR